MKRLNSRSYIGLLVLTFVMSACSGPAENSGSPNTSAPPAQANNNSTPESQTAEVKPPVADPTPPAGQPSPSPAEKPAAARDAKADNRPVSASARAPKLVVPTKTIDYGKQPQDKSLVRAIIVKNSGLADLKLESVVPS